MRKLFKNLLFAFILLVLSASTANASTTVYDRNELDNYGVNKRWEITDDKLDYILRTYKVDASEKIYDFSEILSEIEEEELYRKIKEVSDATGWDIVIFTDSLTYYNDKENEDYAVDFYDFNDFGIDTETYDGVLLFRNTYTADRYYDMYTFGNAQLYFSESRYNEILDGIYYYLSNDQYLEGFSIYLDYLNTVYKRGVAEQYKHAHVNNMGYIIYDYYVPIVPALIFGLVVSIIAISIMASKHKMIKKATGAATYIENDKTVYTRHEDRFIRSAMTSHKIETSSGGGGGGGGHSSSGHSGGGHSSGGGRHG